MVRIPSLVVGISGLILLFQGQAGSGVPLIFIAMCYDLVSRALIDSRVQEQVWRLMDNVQELRRDMEANEASIRGVKADNLDKLRRMSVELAEQKAQIASMQAPEGRIFG